ncbi:MAG TPA: UDP-N-acetylmuramoyl-L-alanyl-D-glutamate--2,6-diaminopimelate ligase [Spirochaetota bacterium]|nr:UDP-N-acetylmuramoyl-L-alanyl-D-glutamate--2,6-diaminopimelate ligase [Spirochaetota bacterium]HPI89861.1 UDP-N-acetylmuramoyl-L-alanyl-D-glutamate--2,6-diaminopimelate ligase [Spirochaetota bacterium]HPR48626.1 UDP-N-acetylmuramoyl-L-alanyl-D-glutamate--2,6-diaminopimelate ligase [Spirochaetota bacterium]
MMSTTGKHEILISTLISQSGGIVALVSGTGSDPVSSVEYDSRKAEAGSLFVAIKGYASDGHDYVAQAVDKGVSSVVVSRARVDEFLPLAEKGVCLMAAEDTRAALAYLSAGFYGFPSKDLVVVGITGTNGKTSITYMLENIFDTAGIDTGVIGTINYRWKGKVFDAPNTTPESRDLQQILSRMRDDGVRAVVMEVSSHALDLGRAEAIDFDAVVFTNLTGDHLDFHGDMESYFKAKKKIFPLLQKSCKTWKFALVNTDDEYGALIAEEKSSFPFPLYGYGLNPDADFRPAPDSIQSRITGISYMLEEPLSGYEIRMVLAGRFHVYNSLAAFAVARNLGLAYNVISRGLAELYAVPGRFDVISSKKGFTVIVDYAHTPDALLKLLQSVRELSPSRIITVFGCGGDRDKTKRPVMGKIASDYSDYVVVTSDNPRKEDPDAIIEDIVSGIVRVGHTVIPDRKGAIVHAVDRAREGDAVVIAGKGHENYQIIGTVKSHFDDREIAEECIRNREAL